MFFQGKNAMSPLIATVLLIAFAVALGAMIMNWSAGIEPEQETGTAVDCSGIAISLPAAICADGNTLSLDVRNAGTARIDGLELVLVNQAEDLDLSLRVRESSLISQERIRRNVTAIVPNLDTVAEINPMLLSDGELIACPAQGVIQDRLVNC